MTLQEIFDTVVNHLRAQRCKSITMLGNKNRCMYRGPNGTKCAAGCLIPDEDYDPVFEGHSIDFEVKYSNEVTRYFYRRYDKQQIDLITWLQGVHDHQDVPKWESFFRDIAHKFNLFYLPPVKAE